MMQRLVLILIVIALVAIIYIVERDKPSAPIGLNPVFQVVGDAQRQAERLPLTVTRVSDAEEDLIGQKIAAGYRLSANQIPDKEDIETYLKDVGSRLGRNVHRKTISYQFYVVNGDNAFALPGGHIAVGRALLKLMKSEDELASVLGHEMAHVDRRHCIERLQYQLAARKMRLDIPYIITAIPIAVFQAGYSKNKELEADRIGLQYAVAAGYSPQGAIDLFRRMRDKREANREQGRSPSGDVVDVLKDFPVAYFRSHPPFHTRLAAIEREIQLQGWKRKPVRPLKPLSLYLQDQSGVRDARENRGR